MEPVEAQVFSGSLKTLCILSKPRPYGSITPMTLHNAASKLAVKSSYVKVVTIQQKPTEEIVEKATETYAAASVVDGILGEVSSYINESSEAP